MIKAIIVLAALSLLSSVVQLVQALTGPTGRAFTADERNVLGAVALPGVFPRLWFACNTVFWATTLVAATAFLRGHSWGRQMLQVLVAVVAAVVILATIVQHQSLTFLEAISEDRSFGVLLKGVLWAVSSGITIGLLAAMRWLSRIGEP